MELWGSQKRSRKNHLILINFLRPLITSKTRLKLLLRFFLNHNRSGYFQELSKMLGENTNSSRIEFNCLEQVMILNTKPESRRKLSRVSEQHPLTENLTAIVRKFAGVDAIKDGVVGRLPSLEQVRICGKLALGVQSGQIDCILVGNDLDKAYIEELCSRVEELTSTTLNAQLSVEIYAEQLGQYLLVWAQKIKNKILKLCQEYS